MQHMLWEEVEGKEIHFSLSAFAKRSGGSRDVR